MNSYSVFFSAQGRGWYPATVPASLQACSYESLVNWAAWEARQQKLKGFLVSENPNPFLLLKRSLKTRGNHDKHPWGVEMPAEVYEKIAV